MDNGASSYRRFLEGDDNAFVEIVRDYKDCLTLYINGIVGNIFIAEDLMQDTLFKLLTKKPRFSGKSSFKTWLYTIARNLTLDYMRKSSKTADFSIYDNENLLVEEEQVERLYLKEEQKIALHKAMRSLKAEYAQVLFLIYFEDFTNGQVAAVMKKSKHQIENLVYRAKAAMKSQLEKEGFVYEEL